MMSDQYLYRIEIRTDETTWIAGIMSDCREAYDFAREYLSTWAAHYEVTDYSYTSYDSYKAAFKYVTSTSEIYLRISDDSKIQQYNNTRNPPVIHITQHVVDEMKSWTGDLINRKA